MDRLPTCYRCGNQPCACRPRVRQGHPIESVLRDGETLATIRRAVEYCEIGWPQFYEMGEPIRIYTRKGE